MGLNIIVCIKSVMVNVPEGQGQRSADSCELNPFDRPALEVALRLTTAHGGSVTALSMGPDSSALALLEAMALGVDRGILVSDPALAGSDTLATSTALAAAIHKLDFDIVLFGTRTSDSDTGQVGPQTAVLLDLPLVTGASSIEPVPCGLRVMRKADGFREIFEVDFPAVLTVHPRAVQPRDLGLYGIETAFEQGVLERWHLKDIDLTPEKVGDAGSPTRVISLKRLKKDRTCEFLTGTTEEQAEALVRRLVQTGLVG